VENADADPAAPDATITSVNGPVLGLVVVATGSALVGGERQTTVGMSSSEQHPAVVGVADALFMLPNAPTTTGLHVQRRGIAEVTAVRGATTLDIRVGDNLTSAADGKAVLRCRRESPHIARTKRETTRWAGH
jgi:hypothetical protein